MLDLRSPNLLLGLVVLVLLARPAAAFGAGNIASISKVEGQNWRHGDIEDALLTLAMARAMKGKKFSKIMVSRVYFGNWLRDYSQAVDVGTVKSVSAEAIRLLLCVLGFLTFGYGSGEFEVTAERLGTYRPEDHIDNPKNYADNQDARRYDRRLRAPVDEERELSVDPATGMKNYIANEQLGIMTSAQHVRRLFGGCIELGRRYKDQGNKDDLYESLRLMGTGLHCLEDFFAHSNYLELALIEMGERDVFPHCGRNTLLRLEGARGNVYPLVTGTFGGVDFLHSVVGEVSDKMTQNEIDELEGTLQEGKNADTSMLRDLLDNIPSGLFGSRNQKARIDEIQSNASTAQMQNSSISPRNPEEFTVYVRNIYAQVMPVIEFHDDVMKAITNAVEKIPVLPKIIEQLEEQLSKFVFSIMAPFVVPLIHQIRNELRTGSSEIVHSSEQEQHVVFDNDRSSDPTHSMLSKDHFTNILNEIAGQSAARMLQWVVPQLMEAIDEDRTDVDRLLDRIIHGVMHHPAQREGGRDGVPEARRLIFETVQRWWQSMDEDQRREYRRKLSRDGVMRGENHKEGENDTGHGCCGKLEMRKLYGEPQTLETKIAGAAADAIFQGATGALSGIVEQNTGFKLPSTQGSRPQEERHEGGGGGLGGLLSAAGSILGGAFGKDETERVSSQRREDDGSFTRSEAEYGRHGSRYGQAEYRETQHPDGRTESRYSRFEQQESGGGRHTTTGYDYEEATETRPTYGGAHYEQRTERRAYQGSDESGGGYGGGGGGYGSHGGQSGHHGYGEAPPSRRQEDSYGQEYGRQEQYGGGGDYGRRQESGGGGGYDDGRGYNRRGRDDEGERYREDAGYGSGRRQQVEESYGGGGRGQGYSEDSYGRREEGGYGGGYESRRESGYGRQERREEYGNEYGEEYGRRGGRGGEEEEEEEEEGEEGGYRRSEGYGRRGQGGYGGGGY